MPEVSHEFDPASYGEVVEQLLVPWQDNELGPGEPHHERFATLKNLSPATLAGDRKLFDRQMAEACCAGLWLYHNFLEESHNISQRIEDSTGSYWHGIMHRREGDFSNAKYWFRKVGPHAIFPALRDDARQLAAVAEASIPAWLADGAAWDPFAFVDQCAAVVEEGKNDAGLCQRIAGREWQLLFDHCFRAAFSRA